MWIAKDLSWTQNWFYPGCLAAAAALGIRQPPPPPPIPLNITSALIQHFSLLQLPVHRAILLVAKRRRRCGARGDAHVAACQRGLDVRNPFPSMYFCNIWRRYGEISDANYPEQPALCVAPFPQ